MAFAKAVAPPWHMLSGGENISAMNGGNVEGGRLAFCAGPLHVP